MRHFLTILGLLTLVSCKENPASKDRPDSRPQNITHLNLLTYNLALAKGYIPYVEERFSHIIKELKKSDADIICLQEVWKDKHKAHLLKEIKSKFPYSLSSPTKQYARKPGWFSGAACRIGDLFGKNKFVSCILDNCGKKSGKEKGHCIKYGCRPSLDQLAKDNRICAEALIASIGQNKVLAFFRLLNPLKMANKFLYQGAVGTMILSKFPLKKSGYLNIAEKSTLANRGALYASVNIKGKEHFIGCTHLPSNSSHSLPYVGDPPYKKGAINFKSKYANENYYHMGVILDEFQTLAGKKPQFFMGDFNCSLKDMAHGIYPDFEKSCQMIRDRGYSDPYANKTPQCTFCHDNTLLQHTRENEMIVDHIYMKNVKKVSSSIPTLKFKKTYPIVSEGKTIMTHLSDHYGIQIKIPVD
jgi:endonuclease/exonuclease/phosphatase family metal-dependent hydrolase